MVKNKIANKLLGMLVAVTMALGMLTNALPVSAGIAEASSATNTTETAFTYASRNVVLDKNRKGLCHRYDGDKQNGCRSHKDPGQ